MVTFRSFRSKKRRPAGGHDAQLVVFYRTDPAQLAACLPPAARPQLFEGQALLAVVFSRGILNPSSRLLAGFKPVGDALGLRAAVQLADDPRPASVLVCRATSSWLDAAVHERLLRDATQRAEFALEENECAVSLTVRASHAAEPAEFRLRGAPCGELKSRVFASARAAEEFLAADGPLLPRDRLGPASRALGSPRQPLACEPLTLFELCADFFAGRTPLDSRAWEFDCAMRLRKRRNVPLAALAGAAERALFARQPGMASPAT